MATTTEKIKISLQADVTQTISQLNKVKSELKTIAQDSSIKVDSVGLNKLISELDQYKKALKQSTAIGSDSVLNTNQLKAFEKNTGNTLDNLINKSNQYYEAAGKGTKVTTDQVESLSKLEAPARRSATAIDKLGVSLTNSLRYNIVNDFVDSFLSKGGEVIDLLSEVDDKLTQIQIVSGKSSAAVQGVREDAIIGAQALASTTQDVLSAYETYYQQGLSSSEARSRAEATIMAANVSDQSVSTTAEQVTAVLNGFNISATNTVDVLGKMANIGAKTATDFSEIASAMQKVASASDVAGLSLDDTLAAMATISSVTREAPETIGTSLNAILGRIGNLKIDDEYTSAIEQIYDDTESGLTLFDKQTGLLKDASTILSELAEKWDILDINQKRAITSQLAGTRQANRLLALMENWDMFEQYQDYAANSESALEEQNDIYLQSMEAAQNRMETAWDTFWLNLFDEDTLKGFYNFSADMIEMFDNATQSAGGLLSIIRTITGLMSKTIGNQVGGYVGTTVQANALRKYTKTQESQEAFNLTKNETNKALEQFGLGNIDLLNEYERQRYFTDEQAQQYEKLTEKLFKLTQQTIKYKEVLESPVFKDFSVMSGNKTQDLSSATDFMNYIENTVKPSTKNSISFIEEGTIQNEFQAYKDSILNNFNRNNINNNRNFDEAVASNINNYLDNLQSSFTTLQKLKDDGRFDQIFKDITLSFEQFGKSAAELRQEFSELYDGRIKNQNVYKSGVQNAINKYENKENLTTQEQAIIDKVKLEQKAKESSTIFSESLYKLLNDGISETVKNFDGRVNDEEFFTALIKVINEGFDKVANTVTLTGGNTISKQASNEIKAKDFLNSKDNKSQITNLFGQVQALGKGADWNKITQNIFTYSQAAGAAISGLTQIMDENTSAQDKMSIGLNALGSAMAAFPGTVGAVGFAISTLGPLFIEIFGIGEDAAKKFQKQVENLNETTRNLTQNLTEQKSEFNNVADSYTSLVELYEKQAFTYEDLNEAQKQQYEQVADYVSTYAPELVKYYDSEGRAVIDLTDKYNTLKETKKSYLQVQLDLATVETYQPMLENVGENAELVIKNYGKQLENVEKYKKELAELQSEAVSSGKDVSSELENVQEKLSTAQNAMRSIGTDWDINVTKVITGSSFTFQNLSESLQNSILELSSYNSYLNSEFGLTTEEFTNKTRALIDVLGSLSKETQKKFEDMDSSVSSAILSITNNMALSTNELKDFLTDITEEDFISGSFLNDYKGYENNDEAQQEVSQNKEILARIEQERKTLENLRKEQTNGFEKEDKLLEFQDKFKEDTGYKSTLPEEPEDDETLDVNDTYENNLEERIDLYDKFLEEQKDKLNEFNSNIINESDLLRAQWGDSLREMASESDEAYNSIAASYKDLMAELEETPETADNYDDMVDRAQRMYAVLQGDNTEYYQNWKSLNADTLNQIMDTYGINADNYKTYNEYMTALDEQKAKLKLLYEVAASEGIEGVEKALFENKKENLLKSLTAEGRTMEAALILATKGSKQKMLIDMSEKKTKLLNLQNELKGEEASANNSVLISKEEADAILYNHAQLSKDMRKNLEQKFGVGNVQEVIGANGGVAYSISGKTGIEALKDTVSEALADLEEDFIEQSNEIDEYAASLNAIQEISALEQSIANLQYNTSDFGKYQVNIKKPETVSAPNNVSKVGGGNKDKGKKGSEEKEVEDMELELDILRPYIIALEELEHQLDMISEKKEQVWGQQYVNYLNQELDLNKKILNTNEAKLKAAQDYANVLKQQLSAQGVRFTDYGAISNYNKILQSKTNAANAKSGDAKKAAQEAVKDFQDLMDKYEEYALDTVRDIEKEILDVRNNIAEAAQEKIEYFVEIIVETKDNKNDLVEFLADVQKYNKGEVNFSIELSNNADQLINSLNALQDIESKTSVDDLIKQVTESPELQGMTDKQLEIIQNRIEELQELGSELMEFEEAFAEAFADAFDEAMDLLDDQLSKYDNILNQYNYILDLAEKLGNNDDLNFNTQTYDKIIDIYKNNLEATKQLAEDIKASRDQFEVGTEDWQTANEKYLEAQSKVIDQEKELTDALENKFDSTVSIGRDQIENILFNGGTLEDAERELEKLNKLRDKYLDKEQKIYSLDKMKYQIMQDMEEYEYNPAAQKELEDWMNKELDYLNNKKDLTQDDLDLAEKQYAVMKARIDMENAYNNKKYTATLQRNADGTYGYMYIQDTSQYEAASQSYRDAIDDLYNYSLERNEALQQENIELKQEALEEYDRIVAQLKAGMITSEEATKLLQETFNQLQENLKQNATEQEQISQNAIAATQLQILMNEMMNSESMERIQNISSETQQIINDNLTAAGMDYDDFVNSKLYQELSREDMFTADVTEEWNKLDELINNDMESIANDFNFDNEDSMISKVVNSINKAYKEFNDVVTDAFQNAIDREEELINSTNDLNKQTVDLNKKLQDEINKVTELKNKYNDLRTNVTKALNEITNSLNKLASAQTNVQNAANKGSSSSSSKGSGSKGSGSSSKGSGSSSGRGSLKKGSSVKVKSGRRWYYDSQGRNPSGPTTPYANRTLYIVNTSSNSYPYALGTSKSIGSALGWVKKSDLVGYDTGGYTGDWYGNEGKLALLHKKEIILKEEDTKNFLQGIELSNELLKEKLQSYKIEGNKNNETVNYNEFKIDFPNATNHNEIQKAIEGLSAMATQYIGRKK